MREQGWGLADREACSTEASDDDIDIGVSGLGFVPRHDMDLLW